MEGRVNDIQNWVKEALGEKCIVEIKGELAKGDNFMGDIIFVTATLDESNQKAKVLNLVVKLSKNDPNMSKFVEIYERELMFYNEIVPMFQQFQKDKKVKEPFDAFANCIKAFNSENFKIIILEDLRKLGYELHPKNISMNLNHMQLALKNYAKFHAISLALRDQKPELLKDIDKTFTNITLAKINMLDPLYKAAKEKVLKNLIEAGRKDLSEKYDNLVSPGISNMLRQIIQNQPKNGVITHNDCHNGNFLFKYEDKDTEKENPLSMVFLDFQLSAVHSPMIDLSEYIYCGASRKELLHLKELLEFYHNELSTFLHQLGSDVNKLYPILLMWEEWRKYGFYGFNKICVFMELLFINNEDAPDNTEMQKGAMEHFIDIKVRNRAPYLERLVDIIEFYLNDNK